MAGPPLLTSVILNWNRLERFKVAFQSYLDTVKVPFELFVVDNASTDGSAEYIRDACTDRSGIQAILLSENIGGPALNMALVNARGKYLHTSENDLEYKPGWDETLLRKLEAFPELGQISPFAPFADRAHNPIRAFVPHTQEVTRDGQTIYLAGGNITTNSVMRREVWDAGFRWGNYVVVEGNKFRLPDDAGASTAVKQRGYWVAWNDAWVVTDWGHDVEEYKANPEYYLENFRAKPGGEGVLHDGLVGQGYKLVEVEGGHRVDRLHTDEAENLTIVWTSPVHAADGFAAETARLQPGWVQGGLPIQMEDLELGRRSLQSLDGRSHGSYVRVWHGPASAFEMDPQAASLVGRTAFGCDGLPPEWVERCSHMDFVWVPGAFNLESFTRAGVAEDKLRVLPRSVDVAQYGPGTQPASPQSGRSFNFLTILPWRLDAGWDVLVRAWSDAFAADDDAALILLVHDLGGVSLEAVSANVQQVVSAHSQGRGIAPVKLFAADIRDPRLPSVLRGVQAYVQPSRADDWLLGVLGAMATGLPVIASGWGSNLDVLTPDNSYLIECDVADVPAGAVADWPGLRWGAPRPQHLAELLQKVRTDVADRASKAQQAQSDVMANCAVQAVSERLRALCNEAASH